MIAPEVSKLLDLFDVDLAALREDGWDAEWISDNGLNGPYAACHVFNENCPCCGAGTSGWTVLNVETAKGASQTWHGDDAQCEAEEHANALNAAWQAGTLHMAKKIPVSA